MAVIGLDLGGTKLAGAIFQPDGNTINKIVLPLEKRGGNEVGDLIDQLIAEEFSFAVSKGMQIDSIGCCVPGIAYSGTGRVWAPNITGWEDYPLFDRISAGIHDERINVILDSDRACSIMGEVWQGAARGCKNAVFLAVGTGIGAGIMVDGKILRGTADAAGAIGWLALDQPFKENYSACGCFEYNASGDGLPRVARDYMENDKSYEGFLSKKNPAELTAQSIFDAFHQNDPVAVLVLKKAVIYWGMCVANLVSLFNPEKIIFGGGVFGPALMFLEDIRSEAGKWAQPISMKQVKIERSALGGDAGLIGAAFLAMIHKPGNNNRK